MAIVIPTPRDPAYWSREALEAEEKRVFEICNGCRLCLNLCPSFPSLFDAVDKLDTSEPITAPRTPGALDALGNHAAATEGAHAAPPRADLMGQAEALEKLSPADRQKVVDLCYQCKLCDPICPYTPPHEFAVDFPRLRLRHKAVDAREKGVPMQDRFLGDPDLVGRIGTLVPSIANWANEFAPNRVLMELGLGVHRDRQLPTFASQTFQAWFRSTHLTPPPLSAPGPKVVLFYTCSVQWNDPIVGRAAVEVLEHNGFTVYAPEMKCCGMPALDGGDVARATEWAGYDVDILAPYVEAGCAIVAPGPTCSYMMKKEWKDYLGSDKSELVSRHAHDLMEFLFKLRKEGRLREDYTQEPGRIGYHLPCHLKVQKIGFRSRDVLKKIPGAEVTLVDQCSCMDGTWGMKKEYYDLSKKGASRLLDGLSAAGAETYSSDCLIAKLQIEEGSGKKVVHPIEIMWRAYGGSENAPLAKLPPVTPPQESP